MIPEIVPSISIKRIYELQDPADGFRILVDRLWPRGLKKESVGLDLWAKDIAPSPALRKWFNHDPQKWQQFQVRYREELKANSYKEALLELIKQHQHVTLLYAAHDVEHNHALVIQQIMQKILLKGF